MKMIEWDITENTQGEHLLRKMILEFVNFIYRPSDNHFYSLLLVQ